MRNTTRELMAREVSDWYHRGIVGEELHKTLLSRYDRRGAVLSGLIKWLGFFAVFSLGSFILGVIAALVQSPQVGAVFVAAGGLFLLRIGAKLGRDPEGKHPFTAALLMAIAVICSYGVFTLAFADLDDSAEFNPALRLCLYGPALIGIAVAYIYKVRVPLLIGLMFLFHAVGSWHRYVGSGTYVFDIQDPRVMFVIAGIVAAFGVYHERVLEEGKLSAYPGFGHFYAVLGLIYFNTALLTMSIYPGTIDWVLVFSAAAIAQIVLGARLKDGRLTGFGVVFLAIDFYTRYFETFWDKLSLGSFFFVAGVLGFALGYLFERRFARETEKEMPA